ncbi:hypothetical protein H1R17_12880 [Flavobacterium sp. xlx-214]|nr:hypothetical protein [Flavobacterium sp. xlx-221]QMI83335.1 hypothetical protein H1R17_12880 [Flavobacterium sp. xlx-214]
MCRYSMTIYKPHYACFHCCKTFKRRLMTDISRGKMDETEAKCPQCGTLMANMGLDFAAPKKDNLKEWKHIKDLYSVGIAFYSCGCYGPGYIPRDKEQLIAYFEEILIGYKEQLTFWRNRIEPTNNKEVQREQNKYWSNIGKIPSDYRPKKGAITNDDAKKYWFERIKMIEQKLKILNTSTN